MARVTRLALFTTLFIGISGPGVASAEQTSPAACATAFHRALQVEPRIAFDTIAPQRDVARDGDARLPGDFVFPAPRVRRDRDEMAALKAAFGLAKGRGRPAWISSANSRWIVDRTITDLTDFMNQDRTPYLCGGVENYVDVLRGYLDRVSAAGGRSLDDLIAAQTERVVTSIEAVLTAMKPVPKPRYAPDFRPIANIEPIAGLRPQIGLRRGRDFGPETSAMILAASQSPRTPLYGPQIDPDLPIKQPFEMSLTSAADRVAAIDRMIETGVDGGFLTDRALAARNLSDRAEPSFRPVLTRLAVLKSILEDPESKRTHPYLRTRLVEALSDIEILDYLVSANRDDADPLLTALERTFEAILEARQTALAK